jgi:predicted HicB family RNase H-like nuclease
MGHVTKTVTKGAARVRKFDPETGKPSRASTAGLSQSSNAPATIATTVRLKGSSHTKAMKRAKDDGRTLNNWITRLVERELGA